MQDPRPVNLTGAELEKVKREIANSNLSESTKSLINGLIQLCVWMQLKLENSRVSISKLKRLFFINSEKRSRHTNRPATDNNNTNNKSDTKPNDNSSTDDTSIEPNNTTVTTNSASIATKKTGHAALVQILRLTVIL